MIKSFRTGKKNKRIPVERQKMRIKNSIFKTEMESADRSGEMIKNEPYDRISSSR